MKIAVLSDIHANLHAFEAVLKDARRRGAKQFLCLGDTVGYGAQPEECVKLVRSIGAVTVKGNHDVWALQVDAGLDGEVSPTVGPGLKHSHLKLSAESQRWLRGLPYSVQKWDVSAVHGTFHQPEKWGYLDTPQEAEISFFRQPTAIAFFGHTHTPGFWPEGVGRFTPSPQNCGAFKLGTNRRYALNPGSVGNPRTPIQKPDSRAQYMIFDIATRSANFIRVTYDIKACIAVMNAAGLSEEMIGRMELGY